MKQDFDHVSCRIGGRIWLEELADTVHVVAGRDQRQLSPTLGPHLTESDGGKKSITDAFSSHRLGERPAFPHVILYRFGWTTIVDWASFAAVKKKKVSKIADPRA